MIALGRNPRQGFTLIEATLAIVIGIIIIAGATVIYNQAKSSAGNTRAKEKIGALQQMIEEYAAQNQGLYPSTVSEVANQWNTRRADDWNKSPWGGVIGPSYHPNAATGVGIGTDQANVMQLGTLGSIPQYDNGTTPANAPTTAAGGVQPYLTGNPNYVGGLVYDYAPAGATFSFAQDLINNNPVTVAGYGVYIIDAEGRMPNWVAGGKPPQ
ncbi:MAG: prepilin-type N-terminal cleavage/methylation domain-containing protein [Cyanobacteria bacterium REEB65]|nr:prepilin-type N-terminal cleavage/methylation domain-containing protein [Cyanobacteria bacterium REEB65]